MSGLSCNRAIAPGEIGGGVTAQVNELMPDGRPAEVAFCFAVSLDDSSMRWLCWDKDPYSPFQIATRFNSE